jgi:hypothetical protein
MKCECGFASEKIRIFPFLCKCGRAYRAAGKLLTFTIDRTPAGPGTELKKLLAELGIKDFAGCSCEKHAAQMNAWGVEGCRENFETIRGWLIEAQAAADWKFCATAAYRAVFTGLAFKIDPLDVPGSLVRLAIAMAAASNTTMSATP